jgi:mRNA interferase RelE/StbE
VVWEILFRRSAKAELETLPRKTQLRVAAAIEALSLEPRPAGCIKLQGSHCWRIRVGDVRIIYSIENGRLVVIIIRIGHRREVYRRL